MLQQFESKRNEIRLIMIEDKDYKQSIKELQEYYSVLKNIKDLNINGDLWFVNYNSALSYKKLGDFKNAIKSSKRALKYYELDAEYTQALWLLGGCHAVIGNVKKAVKIYKRCIHYYKSIEDDNFRICTLYNIAKLLSQSNTMELIIKIYTEKNYAIKTYGDMTKDSVLSEMQKELFEMYIDTANYKGAMKFVHTIKDKDLKKECILKLRRILIA